MNCNHLMICLAELLNARDLVVFILSDCYCGAENVFARPAELMLVLCVF